MKEHAKDSETIPYSIRIREEQRQRIQKVADRIGLKFPDTLRKAVDFGLPELEKSLSPKPAQE